MCERYIAITVPLDTPLERQVYIAESRVTLEQITSGDDAGVLCLMIDESKATRLVDLLNGAGEDG